MMTHDVGGKVRIELPDGIIAEAVISECGQYRTVLRRSWGPTDECALWIGMNPSVADALSDDPTVRREVNYTRDVLGLSAYVKCNVMDFRATDPKRLLKSEVRIRSKDNMPTIEQEAMRAKYVIAAWGALPNKLRFYAREVEMMIRQNGIPLYCIGTTADGSPRHPLYMKKDSVLRKWS